LSEEGDAFGGLVGVDEVDEDELAGRVGDVAEDVEDVCGTGCRHCWCWWSWRDAVSKCNIIVIASGPGKGGFDVRLALREPRQAAALSGVLQHHSTSPKDHYYRYSDTTCTYALTPSMVGSMGGQRGRSHGDMYRLQGYER